MTDNETVVELSPVPFLKWAGGKRALLARILEQIPKDVERYYEPFLGAGSVFFAMPAEIPKHVSDYNSELILTYKAIRDDLDGVLKELEKRSNTKEDYLEVRAWDRSPGFKRRSATSRAARFIFLNRCGFNGLYRLNQAGLYNVPYGKPKSVDIVAEEKLRAVSQFMNVRDVNGNCVVQTFSGDYREILKEAQGFGSLVYLDPPYHPLSPTSSFVSYNENGFSEQNQRELHAEIVRLTQAGVRVLLSNSDTKFIRDLYRESFFKISTVSVRRAIAAKAESRGVITELLIDNYSLRNEGT